MLWKTGSYFPLLCLWSDVVVIPKFYFPFFSKQWYQSKENIYHLLVECYLWLIQANFQLGLLNKCELLECWSSLEQNQTLYGVLKCQYLKVLSIYTVWSGSSAETSAIPSKSHRAKAAFLGCRMNWKDSVIISQNTSRC